MKKTRFCDLCLRGLETMYDRGSRLFSSSYRYVDGAMRNIEEPAQQLKYTMNTLMGLQKAASAGYAIFVDPIRNYTFLAQRVMEGPLDQENLAGLVWAGNTLGAEVPPKILDRFLDQARGLSANRALTAQALGWMILACAAGDRTDLRRLAPELIEHACSRYVHPRSHLVRHVMAGYRRSIASFAASCYVSYALLVAGRVLGDRRATDIGISIARKLFELQGPQGQWAWLYDVPRGTVLDYYPVYSVHQHSMAPLFLLEAIDQGHPEFRQALAKGFSWLHGENELGKSMVAPGDGIIWRSIVRRRKLYRVRTAVAAIVGSAGSKTLPQDAGLVSLNRECRSYELGWGLWAFAGRADMGDLLDHPGFRVQ